MPVLPFHRVHFSLFRIGVARGKVLYVAHFRQRKGAGRVKKAEPRAQQRLCNRTAMVQRAPSGALLCANSYWTFCHLQPLHESAKSAWAIQREPQICFAN